jgi:flagellin
MARTLGHLSTGKRIVTGADDPIGAAMVGTFKAQLGGTQTALVNAEEGLSLMQSADSYLTGTIDILVQMRNLAVRCSTDATLTTAQKQVLDREFQGLKDYITDLLTNAKFNNKSIFSGTINGQELQIGAINGIDMSVYLATMRPADLSIAACSQIYKSAPDAQGIIDKLSTAVATVAEKQGTLGAQAAAIENIAADLGMQVVNIASANSNVEDADLAQEISTFAQQQILAASATAMVAQANAMPQQVVQLLGMG